MTGRTQGAAGASPAPALHPEPGTDAAELRWLIEMGVVTGTARYDTGRAFPAGNAADTPRPEAPEPPEPLAALLRDGILERIDVRPDEIVTRLAAGSDWTTAGPRVRSALVAALTQPWEIRGAAPVPADPADADAALRTLVDEVLAGPIGAMVGSHGGAIAVAEVRGGAVTLALTGACQGCPASNATVNGAIEQAVRARWAAPVEFRQVEAPAPRRRERRFRALSLLPRRRPSQTPSTAHPAPGTGRRASCTGRRTGRQEP